MERELEYGTAQAVYLDRFLEQMDAEVRVTGHPARGLLERGLRAVRSVIDERNTLRRGIQVMSVEVDACRRMVHADRTGAPAMGEVMVMSLALRVVDTVLATRDQREIAWRRETSWLDDVEGTRAAKARAEAAAANEAALRALCAGGGPAAPAATDGAWTGLEADHMHEELEAIALFLGLPDGKREPGDVLDRLQTSSRLLHHHGDQVARELGQVLDLVTERSPGLLNGREVRFARDLLDQMEREHEWGAGAPDAPAPAAPAVAP